MRTPFVAANWKMHLLRVPAARLAQEVAGLTAGLLAPAGGPDVAVCPPATALAAVGVALAGTRILLGAQTMHWAAEGAYTGEVSAPMLVDLGCRTVILGHSERRRYFGERDEDVGRKVPVALDHALVPIVCVGEDLGEHERGDTGAVVTRQVRAAIGGVAADRLRRVVVAYEPVWAIGTGRAATPDGAGRVAGLIRSLLAETGGAEAAGAARILYGGSVTAENVGAFFGQPDLDGALVGGAGLDARSFAAIVRAAAR